MANLDRGAYDSDKLHDFDADEMDDGSEKSRLPLLVLIALVVLGAFGGVVWLAYTQGVERGRADAPRIIVAPSRAPAFKAAVSPYAGLNIYQPSTPAASGPENNGIVPSPPTPLVAAHRASPPPALRPSAATKQEPPLPTPTVAASHVAQPQARRQIAEQSVLPVSKEAEPAQAPPPAQPSAAPDTSSPETPAKSGGMLLQIGSYKSDSEAMRSWNAFKARHSIAASYQPDVQKVDLGERGTWYRLRLGGLADKKSAIALCEKLRSQGASCLIAR
ncbi:MAG TPA: SPOR domain-containing protein [Rhizomicrobium sp.]|jgi:hypothetical protein|nr:SPOR domain-containing protein [Rhizomicrobium sp.]